MFIQQVPMINPMLLGKGGCNTASFLAPSSRLSLRAKWAQSLEKVTWQRLAEAASGKLG